METKVEFLDEKIESIENTAKLIKVKINQVTDQNAISTCIINNLKTQTEENRQYSQRNYLVLEGIALSNKETIPALWESKKQKLRSTDVEKTHRVGPIRDNHGRTSDPRNINILWGKTSTKMLQTTSI